MYFSNHQLIHSFNAAFSAMIRHMDIAIIGAGFCGLAVAWHLIHSQLPYSKIYLFDSKGIGEGASGIAAGLLHPYTGAHAKLNWRGMEGFEATQKLLEAAKRSLGKSVYAENQGILRLALTAEQQSDFQQSAQKYSTDNKWLDRESCQKLVPGCAPFPGLWIPKGLTIYTKLYLQGLWQACQNQGVEFERRHISSLKEMKKFDRTIVTAGAETALFPELASLPIGIVKGQVLELAWPQGHPPLSCSLNSHIYIAMTADQSSCLVGATYERDNRENKVDFKRASEEILPRAYELFPPLTHQPILACYAGLRATSPQHRPLIKRLSASEWVLTGMGSKGLLYHALYAEELVRQILT